jgi:sugar phosphate isomerase/epimerase/catechol 2,3-dioxygenase-like lactoylglutathione lyase family enzyme
MKIALSGTEYDEVDGILPLIENAKANNTRFIELWYPKNTALLGLEETINLLEQEHMQVICVATGSELYRKGGSEKDQRLLIEAIELASKLGAPLVNTYFGYAAEQNDDLAIEVYHNLLKKCLEIAEKLGVTICLENEFNAFNVDDAKSDITRRPESLLKLFERVNHPHFKLTFDPSNFYCASVEAYPYAYNLLQSHIGYVHVKDVQIESKHADPDWCVFTDYENRYITSPLGNGCINWDGIFKQLREDNYQGYLSLEPHSKSEILNDAWKQAVLYVNNKLTQTSNSSKKDRVGNLHHLKLNVSNMKKSLNFYCDKLGFKEMCRYHLKNDGMIVQISHNGLPPGLELWYEKPQLPIENKALHFAFEVKNVPAIVDDLRQKEVSIVKEAFRMGHEHIAFIEDPDGYQIELYHDTTVH